MTKRDWSVEQYPGLQPCANCGQPLSHHIPANYADGPLIGIRVEICPRNVFKAEPCDKPPAYLADPVV